MMVRSTSVKARTGVGVLHLLAVRRVGRCAIQRRISLRQLVPLNGISPTAQAMGPTRYMFASLPSKPPARAHFIPFVTLAKQIRLFSIKKSSPTFITSLMAGCISANTTSTVAGMNMFNLRIGLRMNQRQWQIALSERMQSASSSREARLRLRRHLLLSPRLLLHL